jgi:hypothetical protein
MVWKARQDLCPNAEFLPLEEQAILKRVCYTPLLQFSAI